MVGSVKTRGVANGAAEFDRFKRIRIIERDELGDKIGVFRLDPEMKEKVAGVESAAGVHEPNKRRVEGGAGAEIEFDMGKAVVDGDWHGRRNKARFRSVSREGFGEHQHEPRAFKDGRRRWRRDRKASRGLARRGKTSKLGRKRGGNGKGLSSGNARRGRRRKIFVMARRLFSKMRFVGK